MKNIIIVTIILVMAGMFYFSIEKDEFISIEDLVYVTAQEVYAADAKVSGLPELAATPAGTDVLYIIDGGVSKKITIANEQLGDLTKRFYLVSLYLETKNQGYRLSAERDIVLDYILANSNDSEFENIIDKYHENKHGRRIYYSSQQ